MTFFEASAFGTLGELPFCTSVRICVTVWVMLDSFAVLHKEKKGKLNIMRDKREQNVFEPSSEFSVLSVSSESGSSKSSKNQPKSSRSCDCF